MSITARSNIERIVAILSAFDADNTPRSSGALIDQLAISRSTGFGLIRALTQAGWLERVDHGLVRLGARSASLAYAPIGIHARQESRKAIAAVRPTATRPDAQTVVDLAADPAMFRLRDTSAFRRDGPVRIGFSNASLANPWRRALLGSVSYARRLHASRIAEFHHRAADDDPIRQLAQIDELVALGVDVLIVSSSTSAPGRLNDRMAELSEIGLPLVALDRRPAGSDPIVSFVTASDKWIGRTSALWLAEHLGGKGRVWMFGGLEGSSPAVRRMGAALAAFAEFPGISIEAVSYTGWTEKGGWSAAERLRAAGMERPDGVWCDSGLQGVGSIRWFLSQGATPPPHTGGDLNQMYKLALTHHVPFIALDYPAAMGARAVETALDILSGRPVAQRIELPVPVILPRGHETASVFADIWAENHVRWDLPDDAILSQGPALANADGGGGDER